MMRKGKRGYRGGALLVSEAALREEAGMDGQNFCGPLGSEGLCDDVTYQCWGAFPVTSAAIAIAAQGQVILNTQTYESFTPKVWVIHQATAGDWQIDQINRAGGDFLDLPILADIYMTGPAGADPAPFPGAEMANAPRFSRNTPLIITLTNVADAGTIFRATMLGIATR
jgi:hypothetical protein